MNQLMIILNTVKMKRGNINIPFVVITAAGNEKIAVELMKEGTSDYVLKDLSYEDTLSVVIQRAIDTYNTKKEKEEAEEALRRSEEKYRLLIENLMSEIQQ